MSANTHFKYELSRRDDLESLGYMLLYLATGTLPWLESQEYKFDLIKCGRMKKDINTKNLCHGLPDVFVEYINYVKQLEFTDTPDYERIKSLFHLANEHNIRNTSPDEKVFDWSAK
uniref:Casein kinase I hhp2 n=1 Tax=Sipha flava TaxID=143950 RepID=A0A2S2Q3V4_9HEMI